VCVNRASTVLGGGRITIYRKGREVPFYSTFQEGKKVQDPFKFSRKEGENGAS
jgi:hypothetical protein